MKEILAFCFGLVLLVMSGCVKSPGDNLPVIGTTEVKPLISGIIRTAENGTHLGNLGAPCVKDKIYQNDEDIYLNREPMYSLDIWPNPCQENFHFIYILRQVSQVRVWIEAGTPSYTLAANTNYGAGRISTAQDIYINSYLLINSVNEAGIFQWSKEYFKTLNLMPGLYRLYLQIAPLGSDKTYLLWNDLMIKQ